jgi:hypothetical protein
MKKMIQIHTKLRNEIWHCFATFDCFDYTFSGATKEAVQDSMKGKLKRAGLLDHAVWMEDNIIPDDAATKEDPNTVTAQPFRIDRGIV